MKIRLDNRKKRILLIFCLVFPHIRPSSISAIAPILVPFFQIGSIISFLLITLYIFTQKKKKPDWAVALVILMELWVTFTTFIHKSASIDNNLLSLISSISISLIIYYFSDHMDEVLSALFCNFEWLIYLSLLSIIVYYPKGMYISGTKAQYFLGNENGIIFYVIPALFLSITYIKKEKKRVRPYLLIAACLANELIVWCATAIVGLVITGAVLLFSIRKKKKINYHIVHLVSLLVNLGISVFRVFTRYDVSVYIVNELLNKSLTFSGRVKIWDTALSMIPSCLGSGLGRGDHVLVGYTYFHAHNEYFQLLLVGGIPLLILFILLNIAVGKRINSIKTQSYGRLMVTAMLILLNVQFIATSRLTFRLYLPFTLAAYVREIDTAITIRSAYRTGRKRVGGSLRSA